MKIQHMDAPVEVFKKENIPEKISKKIAAEFGEDYLLDSNMIVFYRGEFDKDKIETLFNITNKAFGEDANRMTIGDFKRFSLDGGPMEQPGEQAEAPQENADTQAEQSAVDDENSDASNDEEPAADNNVEQDNADAVQQTVDDEDEEDKQLDKEVDDIVNEDDEVAEPQPAPPPLGNSYLFLKITTK